MIAFAPLFDNLRKRAPLIHCITNYVTANDCANLLLACGASPVMADDPGEAAEFTSRADGLLLNLGTLSDRRAAAMLAAGKRAVEMDKPVTLDPVGAGASGMRGELARRLLGQLRFSAIRGNASEIAALAGGRAEERGVDAAGEDGAAASCALALAEKTGAVIAMTGATDIVTDGKRLCYLHNGCPIMAKVTGAGCMLSALLAAWVAANREAPFEACCAAVACMGLCGETAYARMGPMDGNGSFRTYLIDAAYQMTAEKLREGAKYEMR